MGTRNGRRPSTGAARTRATSAVPIVVTPASGHGRALATARELQDALGARGCPTRLEVFADLERLRRWTRAETARFPLVVCVGGDGTQSAAARAALERGVPFLPVSSGFGNLFARAFGAPRSVAGALDPLARGRVVRSDGGTRNGELFLCEQSYGLVADVQEAVESSASVPRARWRRWVAYDRAALRRLRERPWTRLRVVVDGRVVAIDAALVVVANVPTYGAWRPLTPDASPVDGLFDVFVMEARPPRQVFASLLRRHLRVPGTEAGTFVCRGRRVQVSGPPSAQYRLEVLARQVPIIVSPATAAALRPDPAREGSLALEEVLVA
jgi:diacylglycerol kinase (ATP)